MAIIIGGSPKAEKQRPMDAPESKINLDAQPVEIREESVEESKATKAEVERPVEEAVKPAKRVKRNVKKA